MATTAAARPGSVTRSATTEGKRDSTTGTSPERPPIRGVWTRTLNYTANRNAHTCPDVLLPAELFTALAVILNKPSRMGLGVLRR